MALPSESMIELIEADPIKDKLNPFLATFTSTYPNARAAASVATCESLLLRRDGRDLAFKLIGALLLLPVASALPSTGGDIPLSGEIALLYSRISSSRTDVKLVAGLLHAVVTQEDDQKIWKKVYEVIARTGRKPQSTTPPPSHPSFATSFQQTPWSFNTGSFADTSEHRNQVDGALKEELLPGLRLDIPDFVPAVFGQVPHLDKLAGEVFDKCQDRERPLYQQGAGWTKWPPSAKEELVLEWLQDLMKRLTVLVNVCGSHSTARRQIYQGPTVYLDGSPIKRKMDIGIAARHGQSKSKEDGVEENLSVPISNWDEILVTGELKSNVVLDGQTPAWLDLATYAREVFRAQNRRFVLGFTLCGSMMRLWQFDRSGSLGSSSFDINEDGFKFVHAILGYFLMNDKQLGCDPTIRQSDGKCYVEVSRAGQTERLILTKLIKKQALIAGRATTCWRAYRDGDELKTSLIVKDSWQYEERPEEGALIKEATDKGVRNIARYYHHETVQVDGKNDDTSENVRKGLMKKCGRTTFREKSVIDSEAPASESLGQALAGRTQSRSASRKRSSNSTRMAPPPAKRSCSSPRSRNLGTPTHNRVRRRVVTRDPGRPIYEASSRVAVINGFLGAIFGHESLLNAGILHRDVSIGNIILTENEDNGFLIDLDLAIKTSENQASGAPSKTGTKIFMAIGALYGEPHSFMHDLESFFWVLFWICIHHDGLDEKGKVKRRRVPEYEKWNYEDTGKLADSKRGLVVEEERFNKATAGFTNTFQSLAPCVRTLRQYVFPNGKRWLGENKELYSQMRAVLEKARKDLES
ncbi:MAG: hypothetical protein Q9209_007804 [Squamulea sp. 1 TL-2023]